MLSVLSLLAGCDRGQEPYAKKDGVWRFGKEPLPVAKGERLVPLNTRFAKTDRQVFYRSTPIPGADSATFEALDEHYAVDKTNVYYADAHRTGQDYFTKRHDRIRIVPGADPATMKAMEGGYGRDGAHAYYEGRPFRVRDVNTLVPLDDGFARDGVRGYYMQTEIPDSDGASFSVIGEHYARDKDKVFYSQIDNLSPGSPPRTVRIIGGLPLSFSALTYGYAKDAGKAYFQGQALDADVGAFQVLDFGYAKSRDKVFYYGREVAGADPSSFAILAEVTDQATAKDNFATYKDGKRTLLR